MSHRIPNQAAVASAAVVTVGFTLSTSYTQATANAITINWPVGFFNGSAIPTVSCSGGAMYPLATVAVDYLQGTFILTTLNGWDTTAKMCVFSSIGTGSPTSGGMISVKSSQDSISTSIQSGRLGGLVTGVAFVIAAADRVPGASNKQVTVSFTIQTALIAADTITINYPEGFFCTWHHSLDQTFFSLPHFSWNPKLGFGDCLAAVSCCSGHHRHAVWSDHGITGSQ